MTVAELIEKLKKLPLDVDVIWTDPDGREHTPDPEVLKLRGEQVVVL